MILSDKKILEEIEKKNIIIEPFNRDNLGSNSYDVHLGKWLAVYDNDILDAKVHNKIKRFEIPDDGFILLPSKLYLGLLLNIRKQGIMSRSLKGNQVWEGLESTSILLQVKVMRLLQHLDSGNFS